MLLCWASIATEVELAKSQVTGFKHDREELRGYLMADNTRAFMFLSTQLKTIHLVYYDLSPSSPGLCF